MLDFVSKQRVGKVRRGKIARRSNIEPPKDK
jgi:hypothetical protein